MNLKQKVELIKKGKLSAEKNVAEFGEKIQKLNKELNIYLCLNVHAIEQAKEIDKRIKQGKEVVFSSESPSLIKFMLSRGFQPDPSGDYVLKVEELGTGLKK